MPPSIAPPPPDVLAALMLEHAHRFPQQAKLHVPDGGADVTLPILIGIPTGAVRLADGEELLPNGRKPSTAWSQVVAAALGFRPEGEDDARNLVADCVIYPPITTWREWCERWPALDLPALRLVKTAIGRDVGQIYAPDEGEPVPAGVKVGERGTWRRLQPVPGTNINIPVETPAADNWRAYLRLAQVPGANVAAVTRDIVDFCTGSAALETLDRFPGLVVTLAKTAAYLAGAGAQGELGNW